MKAKRVKLAIKKGATVEVISGQDKGKRGAVLAVDPVALKIKVQAVKMQTHYSKQEGISTREGFIDYSNVKLLEAAKPAEKKTAKKKSAK
ncbi:MAG: KOW motif-containing protein [Bdellovibrionales bacterium]